MDEIKATEILEEAIGPDCCGATLLSLRQKTRFEKPEPLEREEEMDRIVRMRPWTFSWSPPHLLAGLNGLFTADELEAIAWWMRNKKESVDTQLPSLRKEQL